MNNEIIDNRNYLKEELELLNDRQGYLESATLQKKKYRAEIDKIDKILNNKELLKDEYIKKCYEYKKPFCLLLPITSLEGIERGKMFRENDIQLLVLDRRCNFIYNNAKKSNWFNTSWFCWNILPKQLIFEELIK